jgi:hypothetical protein
MGLGFLRWTDVSGFSAARNKVCWWMDDCTVVVGVINNINSMNYQLEILFILT